MNTKMNIFIKHYYYQIALMSNVTICYVAKVMEIDTQLVI